MSRRSRRVIIFRRNQRLEQPTERQQSRQRRRFSDILESNNSSAETISGTPSQTLTAESDEQEVSAEQEVSVDREDGVDHEPSAEQEGSAEQEASAEQGDVIIDLSIMPTLEQAAQAYDNVRGSHERENELDNSFDDEVSSNIERTSSSTTVDRISSSSNIDRISSSSTSTSNSYTESPTQQLSERRDPNRDQTVINGSHFGTMIYAEHATLENRLSTIVRCTICQLAPLTALYQCSRAHLICAGCYQIRVSDKSLGMDMGTCPTCHVRIYRKFALRNLIAEEINEQLPVMCQNCLVVFVRGDIQKHQRHVCSERPRKCRFRRLGCMWQGPQCYLRRHESRCPTANLTGGEISKFMLDRDKRLREERQVLSSLVTLLQRRHLTFRMFQHFPHLARQIDAGEYLPLTPFKAFDHAWLIELMWQPADEAHGGQSTLSYRLKLTDMPPTRNVFIQYTLLRATYCDAIFVKHLSRFEFTASQLISPNCVFMIDTSAKCAEMLHEKVMYMRLCMTID